MAAGQSEKIYFKEFINDNYHKICDRFDCHSVVFFLNDKDFREFLGRQDSFQRLPSQNNASKSPPKINLDFEGFISHRMKL